MHATPLRVGLFHWLSAGCLLAGCASSQEVMSVRQDVQKELQEARATSERAMAKADASRKAFEESQNRLATDLKNQDQHLTVLSKKMQELQARQEYAIKERASTQETNRALRDAILHALKTEQADLQQRLKRVSESIGDMEQSQSPPARAPGGGQPAAVDAPKSDKPAPDNQPATRPGDSTSTN